MGTQKDMASVELKPSLHASISIFGIINIFLPQQLTRNKVGSQMLKIIVGTRKINSSLLLYRDIVCHSPRLHNLRLNLTQIFQSSELLTKIIREIHCLRE